MAKETHHGENSGSQQHCEANQPDPRQGLCGSEASPAAALSETKGKEHCSKCMCFLLSHNALCVLGSAVLFICIWGISKHSHLSVSVNGFENFTHLFTPFQARKVDLYSLNAQIPSQTNASLPVKQDGSISAELKSNVFPLRGRVFTAALC